MTQLAKDFSEWYQKAVEVSGGSYSPEDVLSDSRTDLIGHLEPDQVVELDNLPFDYQYVDIDRDYSEMQAVYSVKTDEGEKFLMLVGFYDSWNGTEWDSYEWKEVQQLERIQKYWSEV